METKDYAQKMTAGYYALVIYDQCRPKTMPQADTLFIGTLPAESSWSWGEPIAAPQIIDVETAHPLMQLIDLGDVKFAEARVLKTPPGGTVLVDSHAGPMFAIAPRGAYEDAVLAAEIVGTGDDGERYANTDWPLRLSFPVFVLNTIRYFGTAGMAADTPSVRPGKTVSVRSAESVARIEVRTPGGKVASLSRDTSDTFSFSGTDELGVYQIEEPNQPVRRFAVNLFDSAESNIERRNDVEIGYVEVKGQAVWEPARRELWKVLLLVALGVLCLEWYIYNRRVYV